MSKLLSPEDEEQLRQEVIELTQVPDSQKISAIQVRLRVLVDEQAISQELFDNASLLLKLI